MKDRIHPTRRRVLQGIAGAAALSAVPRYAHAQQGPVRIGLILPMTGRSPPRASRCRPPAASTCSRTATRSPAARSS